MRETYYSTFGDYLEFDGIASYVSLPITVWPGTTGMWEGRVKTGYSTLSSKGFRLLGTDHSAGGKSEVRFYKSDLPKIIVANGSDYLSILYPVISDDIWTMIGFSWRYNVDSDNTLVILYLNGRVSGHATMNGSIPSPDLSINLGRFDDDYYTGYLDEVRFWNAVPLLTDIARNANRELAGTEDGLLAYYKFNEGGGIVATDSTANSLDGTIISTTRVSGFISSTEVCARCGLETPKAKLNELGNCNRTWCRDEYDRDMPTREEEAAPSNPDRPGWSWGDGDWDR